MGRRKFALNKIQLKNRLAEMFWNHVKMTDDCWQWTGVKNKQGYGLFIIQEKTYVASRVSFFLYNSRWPIEACHKCDNPNCVSFYHIFEGSHRDNMHDMAMKLKKKRIDYANSFIDKSKR